LGYGICSLQELALLTGAVMSIAALFGCSPLWNSSRNAHKAPQPAASGCAYVDRSIATLVNCQPRPASLIRNKTFTLYKSPPIDLVGSTISALRLQPLKRISARQ